MKFKLAITTIAVSLAGLGAWQVLRPKPVSVVVLVPQKISQTIVASGRVEPMARIHLGSLILGKVVEVAADEGDAVSEGQILIKLEDAEARSAVQRAKGVVWQSRARIDQLCKIGAPTALQELRQAEAALQNTETEFERIEQLYKKGAATRAQFDALRTQLQIRRSNEKKAGLKALNMSCSGSEHRLAVSALLQNEASLEAATARLAHTLISTPSDGLVLKRMVEAGDIVQPGKTLMLVAKRGRTTITLPLDEKYLGQVKIGQKALAVADAFPQKPFQVELSAIAPIVDAQRGTVALKFALQQRPDFLRSDMTVSVELIVASKDKALVVPRNAVFDLESTPWVLVAQHGKTEKRAVQLGLTTLDNVEILSGLRAGELVVNEKRLVAGARVRVVTQE